MLAEQGSSSSRAVCCTAGCRDTGAETHHHCCLNVTAGVEPSAFVGRSNRHSCMSSRHSCMSSKEPPAWRSQQRHRRRRGVPDEPAASDQSLERLQLGRAVLHCHHRLNWHSALYHSHAYGANMYFFSMVYFAAVGQWKSTGSVWKASCRACRHGIYAGAPPHRSRWALVAPGCADKNVVRAISFHAVADRRLEVRLVVGWESSSDVRTKRMRAHKGHGQGQGQGRNQNRMHAQPVCIWSLCARTSCCLATVIAVCEYKIE